jgi:hypothetical protein
MRRPLLPPWLPNPSEFIHFSSPPLPFPATTLYSLLHASQKQRNPETIPGTKFAQAIRSPIRQRIEPVLCCRRRRRRWVRPITVRYTRLLLCLLLAAASCDLLADLASASCLLQIDGIVVAERGARSCVECRATTTPMWRSGPTGPRVSSSSSSSSSCPLFFLVLRCSVLFVRIRPDRVGDSDD